MQTAGKITVRKRTLTEREIAVWCGLQSLGLHRHESVMTFYVDFTTGDVKLHEYRVSWPTLCHTWILLLS